MCDVRRILTGSQGIAVEAAARVSESKLIDLIRRDSPGLFECKAIGARQRVADHGRRDVAAAIRQWSYRPRIVAEVLVSPEEAIGHVEVVIEPNSELLLIHRFVANPNVIVRRCFPSSGKNVRQWIPIQKRDSRGIESIPRYRVVEKPIAYEAACRVLCGGRVIDRCAENSLALKACWDCAGSHRACLQPRTLIVDKKERLILPKRAAEDKPVLVSPESGLRPRWREKIAGVQCLVPKKLEHRPMKIIRTRLVVDHDDAAVRPAIFGRVAVRVDAKFVDRIHYWEIRDLARLRLKNADAIVNVFADSRPASVDTGERRGRGKHDSWRERDERNKVSSVEWKGHNFLLFHDETHGSPCRLQERRSRRYIHRFRHAAEFECEIQHDLISNVQGHAISPQCREPGLRSGDCVSSRLQRNEVIHPVIAGGSRCFHVYAVVDQANLRLRHGQSGRIANGARQLNLCRLGRKRC